MQAEDIVKLKRRSLPLARLWDGDTRSGKVVVGFAEWYDHVQSIDGAPLEHDDQHTPPPALCRRRTRQK